MTRVTVFGPSVMQLFVQEKRLQRDVFFAQADHNSSTDKIDGFINEPGGEGLLAASVFARHGYVTQLATKISTDVFGKALKSVLQHEAVVLNDTSITKKSSTDFLLETKTGSSVKKQIFDGCFSLIDKSDIKNLAQNTDWLHVASLAKKNTLNSLLQKLTKQKKVPISFHINNSHLLPTRLLKKILHTSSLIVLSRDEACAILGGFCTTEQTIEKLQQLGVAHFVVFDSTRAIAASHNGVAYKCSIEPLRSIDTNGIETVATAAYIAEFVKSQDIKRALKVASAQVRSVSSVHGARAAILTNPIAKKQKITLLTNSLRSV